MIVPAGSGDEMKTHPIGTGPFKFKEWVKGEKAVYVKNEDYWQPGIPLLDEVTYQFQTEYQTRLASLRAGDSDVILVAQPSDVAALEKEPGIEISPNLLLGTFYVGFQTQTPPFDDVNMRQAVRYAIDKQLVMDTAQAGQGAVKDIMEAMDTPFYTTKFNYNRDLGKVQEFLENSGYDGEEVELTIPNTPREGPAGDAVAFALSEAGINVKPNKLPVPEFVR
jgi:ABC-type transport system substrate-binding protein